MSGLGFISDIANMFVSGDWVWKDRRDRQVGRMSRIEKEIQRSQRHLDEMYPPRGANASPDLADEKETR